jgi:hypothetical protein
LKNSTCFSFFVEAVALEPFFGASPIQSLDPERWLMRKYMVIETFFPGCQKKVYERFHQKGRMLPDGLLYIDSWLEEGGERCFQLMETDEADLFEQWTKHWSDLCNFEIVEIGKKPEVHKA